MNSLEARAVTVARGGRRILHGVNLKVEPGVVMAIAGPNGSGKSTLLRALAGIWPVADGSVALDGKPLGTMGRRAIAQRIAFVAQDNRLDFAFSVAEIVAMAGIRIAGDSSARPDGSPRSKRRWSGAEFPHCVSAPSIRSPAVSGSEW
jgi:ABC-type cobalamin/Fe3+-siderophores transport system ATPase subunit